MRGRGRGRGEGRVLGALERLRESYRRYGLALTLATLACVLGSIGTAVSALRGSRASAIIYATLTAAALAAVVRAWRRRKGAGAPLKYLEEVWEEG
ncbi:MAG: hypothetical protein QI223_05580 [Candidatus Korarchaeota archaeon]|nr:hypothetical protein [Candidatus Korarchaeota archaeon]